ncbi:MAG: hypothetical protein GC131_00985 [Alphaproteobacteria bacterium]|nr:hypothetical protein [Alphaproteobacteria bacterium]
MKQVQTAPPVSLDLQSRLAAQAPEGIQSLLASVAGAGDNNVLGGLRTNAENSDPNNTNPHKDGVNAANIRGSDTIPPTARVDVANFALANPVAREIEFNLKDARAPETTKPRERMEIARAEPQDNPQPAPQAEAPAYEPTTPTVAAAPAATAYATAASSYSSASGYSATASSNSGNTVNVAA